MNLHHLTADCHQKHYLLDLCSSSEIIMYFALIFFILIHNVYQQKTPVEILNEVFNDTNFYDLADEKSSSTAQDLLIRVREKINSKLQRYEVIQTINLRK